MTSPSAYTVDTVQTRDPGVEARLVVLGTRARRPATRALFGSTSRGVLRRSPVPVVVVNPGTVRLDEDSVLAAAAPEPKATVEDPHDRIQLG